MTNTRILLGLDVGKRRIGVAIGNTTAKIGSPLLTIDTQEVADVYGFIDNLIKDNNVQGVVVGLPRDMKSEETVQTLNVRNFAEGLASKCDVKIYMQDEAVTSIAAEEALKSYNKPYSKADIDMNAAAIILEDWLRSVGEDDNEA